MQFTQRLFNVQQWTEMPVGGHFTAMEQPDLFANDIRKFSKSLGERIYRQPAAEAGTEAQH